MRKIFLSGVCACLVLLNAGCQGSKTRAAEGAAIGGLLGAAAGGIIGHQSRHGGEGAAIGLAAGAVTGAIVGSKIEKPGQPATQPATAQQAQTASPNQMSVQQIIDLSRQGINESVIIDKIRLTNSRFTLAASDIDYLRQQGVSQKVIDAMQGM